MNLAKFSAIAVLVLASVAAYAQLTSAIAVETIAPTLSAEEIETQITIPLERRLGKLAGILQIRSSSAEKVSYIEVYSSEHDAANLLLNVRATVIEARSALPATAAASSVFTVTQARLR